MANLDVVPKRGVSAWVWIVIAIVVIAILWMVLGRSSSAPHRTGRLTVSPPHAVALTLAAAPSAAEV